MSFEDYCEARKLHLMVAVVYNGGGFGPLLRLFREKQMSITGLLQKLVESICSAPCTVQEIFNSFVRLTKEELWASDRALRSYICTDDNYEKLKNGEIGINLIQTHIAMSMAVMDDWVGYVFEAAETMCGETLQTDADLPSILADIRAFCRGCTHNLWGANRNEDIPYSTLKYDIIRCSVRPKALLYQTIGSTLR
jgi:hypothetical protein